MMREFFLIVLGCGVLLLFFIYKYNKRFKLVKSMTNSSAQTSDTYLTYTQKDNVGRVFESSDKFLAFLRKFDESIFLKILSFIVIFLIIYICILIFNLNISREKLAILLIFIFIICIVLPGFIRKILIENRIKNISTNIPMFVDLLAVCVQAGMDIQGAIIFLEGNISHINKDFAPFLNRLILKSEISGLDSALNDLQEELPSIEISMMCTTLRQSLRYGSAIYDSLIDLSMEIREMELLRTEEAIGKLSAKMSVPLILFFMFPVIIIIAAPGVLKILGGF